LFFCRAIFCSPFNIFWFALPYASTLSFAVSFKKLAAYSSGEVQAFVQSTNRLFLLACCNKVRVSSIFSCYGKNFFTQRLKNSNLLPIEIMYVNLPVAKAVFSRILLSVAFFNPQGFYTICIMWFQAMISFLQTIQWLWILLSLNASGRFISDLRFLCLEASHFSQSYFLIFRTLHKLFSLLEIRFFPILGFKKTKRSISKLCRLYLIVPATYCYVASTNTVHLHSTIFTLWYYYQK